MIIIEYTDDFNRYDNSFRRHNDRSRPLEYISNNDIYDGEYQTYQNDFDNSLLSFIGIGTVILLLLILCCLGFIVCSVISFAYCSYSKHKMKRKCKYKYKEVKQSDYSNV